MAVRPEPPAAPAAVPYRVTVPLPDGFLDSDSTFPGLKLGVSPDGRRVVVRGTTSGTRNQLWVGSLVDGTFHAMADTQTGLAPAWSPDSTRIAFSGRQQLRVVSADGGSSTVVGDRGYAAWGADDVLLVARLGTPLSRASASGGPYRVVHERKGSEFFGIPWFLDDGRRYIYGLSDREHPDTDGIYRASLDGAQPVRIFRSTNDVNVAYANGALLYVRGAALIAHLRRQPESLGEFAIGDAATLRSELARRERCHPSHPAEGSSFLHRRRRIPNRETHARGLADASMSSAKTA
jgi:Tol biopolymer transport system component